MDIPAGLVTDRPCTSTSSVEYPRSVSMNSSDSHSLWLVFFCFAELEFNTAWIPIFSTFTIHIIQKYVCNNVVVPCVPLMNTATQQTNFHSNVISNHRLKIAACLQLDGSCHSTFYVLFALRADHRQGLGSRPVSPPVLSIFIFRMNICSRFCFRIYLRKCT